MIPYACVPHMNDMIILKALKVMRGIRMQATVARCDVTREGVCINILVRKRHPERTRLLVLHN